MNMNPKPAGLVIAAGMKARHLAGKLHEALNTKEQWLEKDLQGQSIKLTMNPYLKQVLYEVCADRRDPMVEYVRQALIAAIKRDLEADIAAMDAMDAPQTMTLVGPDDSDVLNVEVA